MKFYSTYKILFSFLALIFSIKCFADQDSIQQKLSRLELKEHIHIGIAAINMENNQTIYYRADERFPIQSTFKLIGVSAVLHQAMTNLNLLNQKIAYKKSDVVFWSPITEKNINNGMSISQLCAAAMMFSDDTAINLVVKKLGGLNTVVDFARFLKDDFFKLNHFEPNMNSNPSSDEDTSTPRAMQNSLQQLAFGKVLSPPMREQLVDWMKRNTTGDARIRAGVPKEWIVADKTGSGSYGVSNDIAIIWPPKKPPIILAIYTVHPNKKATPRDDILAYVTRLIIAEFSNQKINPKAEVLQRIDLPKTHYQLGMGIVNYGPNAIKTAQVQNGPEILYILDGDISYVAKGKPPKNIKKGESYQIPVGEIHYSQAGPRGATILASWVLEKNKPFALPMS